VEACGLASLWWLGPISLVLCLLMIHCFFVGLTQIIYVIYEAFLCFEAASGLKMNLAKLELVLVGNANNVAGILGCGVASLPMKYIGFPLEASYKAKHIWDGVIEKIERWLAS